MGDAGSLLHLSLLSPRPHVMIGTVVSWGERFERDGEQVWPWQEHNWLGLTALDIVAGCAPEDQRALLTMLLLRAPAQYAHVSHALQQPQAQDDGAFMPQQAAAPDQAIPSHPHSTGSTASNSAPGQPEHSVWLSAMRQSLARGFTHNRHSPAEAAYLSWAHHHTLPLSRVRFVLLLLGCVVGIFK